MVRKGRKGSKSRRRQRGGEFNGGRTPGSAMTGGGSPPAWKFGEYNDENAPIEPSQYYTISAGGGRRRRNRRSRRSRKNKKGGDGIIATAAVPFGLLALQRYFKGSKTSKQGVAKMGRSFKRTFRRHRGGGKVPALSASTY